MERRPYEVKIDINVYDKKANINGNIYETQEFMYLQGK